MESFICDSSLCASCCKLSCGQWLDECGIICPASVAFCVRCSSLLSHAGALGKVGLMFWAGYQEGCEPNAFPPPLVRQPRATACVNSGLLGFVTGLVNWPGAVSCARTGQGETTAAFREIWWRWQSSDACLASQKSYPEVLSAVTSLR